MTVRELIERLQKVDPDLTVTVDGYEGGVSETINIEIVHVATNVNTHIYLGEHEPLHGSGTCEVYGNYNVKPVLNIGRT